MIRFLAAFVFIAFLGGSSLKACSCSLVSTPGSCGNLAGTPVKGSMSFVGTVTGAEHAQNNKRIKGDDTACAEFSRSARGRLDEIASLIAKHPHGRAQICRHAAYVNSKLISGRSPYIQRPPNQTIHSSKNRANDDRLSQKSRQITRLVA